ncbi:GtrA family protein [Xanthomonas indica]|uniref:GtrA family protein n=1 Tax=Xanthomonas indica TaxID=2912242 RepID=A0AAU8I8V7_9XANT|nr:GtrA family protein [Xanthomonas indica]MCI2261677.1 GtrA family protein [Xanthomonas indica]
MSPLPAMARSPRLLRLRDKWGPLLAQMAKFGFVGGIQLAIDWMLFVALTWGGAPLIAANLVGRVGGAVFGFWLNGKYTFGSGESVAALSRTQAVRFALTWVVMSILSSALVWVVGRYAGMGWAWTAKPAGDVLLALASFFISKHWIYR